MRKTAVAIALALAGSAAFAMTSADAAPGDPGCVAAAPAQPSCQFTGNGSANGGYAAVSDNWQITHQELDPTTGTMVTVVDASGTAPNGAQFVFTSGVVYTATVADGSLAAGAAG